MTRSHDIRKITPAFVNLANPWRLFALALYLACIAPALHAQQAAGAAAQLRGKVLDTTRVPIEGATVTASTDGGAAITAVTDASGDFSLELSPGMYQLKISAPDFTNAKQTVTLPSAGADSLQIVLEVAPLRDVERALGPSVTIEKAGAGLISVPARCG